MKLTNKILLGSFLHLALLLTLACSLAGFLAPFSWIFDLFNHFRVQGVIAGFVLGASAIALRDRAGIACAVVIMLLNSALICAGLAAFPYAGKDTAGSGTTIKIVSANVWNDNTHYDRLVALIEKERPDIFVATEPNVHWIAAFQALKKDYPYAVEYPGDNNFGMAVYARLPFVPDIHWVGAYGLPLAHLRFEGFDLFAAHPVPPIGKDYAAEQGLYLTETAKLISSASQPIVLAGDLNSTLWSGNMRRLSGIGLQRSNPWPVPTWPVYFPPIGVEIDHIFTRGMAAQQFVRLPDVGSDHYPIEAVLTLR